MDLVDFVLNHFLWIMLVGLGAGIAVVVYDQAKRQARGDKRPRVFADLARVAALEPVPTEHDARRILEGHLRDLEGDWFVKWMTSGATRRFHIHHLYFGKRDRIFFFFFDVLEIVDSPHSEDGNPSAHSTTCLCAMLRAGELPRFCLRPTSLLGRLAKRWAGNRIAVSPLDHRYLISGVRPEEVAHLFQGDVLRTLQSSPKGLCVESLGDAVFMTFDATAGRSFRLNNDVLDGRVGLSKSIQLDEFFRSTVQLAEDLALKAVHRQNTTPASSL